MQSPPQSEAAHALQCPLAGQSPPPHVCLFYETRARGHTIAPKSQASLPGPEPTGPPGPPDGKDGGQGPPSQPRVQATEGSREQPAHRQASPASTLWPITIQPGTSEAASPRVRRGQGAGVGCPEGSWGLRRCHERVGGRGGGGQPPASPTQASSSRAQPTSHWPQSLLVGPVHVLQDSSQAGRQRWDGRQ